MPLSKQDRAKLSPPAFKDVQVALFQELQKAFPRELIECDTATINATHFLDRATDKRYFYPTELYEPEREKTMQYFLNEFLLTVKEREIKWVNKAPYTPDILIRNLVIEIDGITHLNREEKDEERDFLLSLMGYITIRFEDSKLKTKKGMQEAILKIKELLE